MTDLFDPPMNKYDLPKHNVSARDCFIIAALSLAPVTIGVAIAQGDINPSSAATLISTDGKSQEHEGFCDSLTKHPNNRMAEFLGRTFCGYPPKQPGFDAK